MCRCCQGEINGSSLSSAGPTSDLRSPGPKNSPIPRSTRHCTFTRHLVIEGAAAFDQCTVILSQIVRPFQGMPLGKLCPILSAPFGGVVVLEPSANVRVLRRTSSMAQCEVVTSSAVLFSGVELLLCNGIYLYDLL